VLANVLLLKYRLTLSLVPGIASNGSRLTSDTSQWYVIRLRVYVVLLSSILCVRIPFTRIINESEYTRSVVNSYMVSVLN
jgi:hypothetical protein